MTSVPLTSSSTLTLPRMRLPSFRQLKRLLLLLRLPGLCLMLVATPRGLLIDLATVLSKANCPQRLVPLLFTLLLPRRKSNIPITLTILI